MFDSLFPKHWTTLQRLMWLKTNALARAVYEIVTGNPVSFTARNAPLRKLEVAFSPKQDLHGYDAPWPAGGGKNKFDVSKIESHTDTYGGTISQSNGTISLTTSTGSSNVRCGKTLEQLAPHLTVGETYILTGDSTATSAKQIYLPAISTLWKFGDPLTITQEALNSEVAFYASGTNASATITQVMIRLSSVSDATYAPYSNICPILGWDSLNVEQRGVNLWDEETESGYIRTTDGVPVPDPSKIRMKNPVPVKANTTYYYKTPVAFYICCYDSNMTFIGRVGGSKDATFTTPANCAFIRAGFEAAYGTTYNHDISINYPATDTAYHAYNPSSSSISISLGSTVYSGYVDVVTGQGRIDKVAVPLTGERFVNYSSTISAIYGSVTAFPHAWAERNGGSAFMFSDGDATTRALMPSKPNAFACGDTSGGNNKVAFIKLDGITTSLANGKAFLDERYSGGNPVTVCYELATPIPIQLTPQEVNSLAGDNTMWSNANQPITVEYRKN